MSIFKDYKSFSVAAKSRFRWVAEELHFEQLTGTLYTKERDGWFEGFSLQASTYGNDFFYVNYGVLVPGLWDGNNNDPKSCGYILRHRLQNEGGQGFGSATKLQIEESSIKVLKLLQEQAAPWFLSLDSLGTIAEQYFRTTNLSKSKLGSHTGCLGLNAANYGLLLFKGGDKTNALLWLEEAQRLLAQGDDSDEDDIESIEQIEVIVGQIKKA